MAEKNAVSSEEGPAPPFDGAQEREHDKVLEGTAVLGSEDDLHQYGYVQRG